MIYRQGVFTIISTLVLLSVVRPVLAHQIWIEVSPTARINEPISLDVCFGHSGERSTGPVLASNHPKLSATVKAPDGHEQSLALKVDDDGYPASFRATQAGFHHIGALLETGIIERELHQIPPKTRIVMMGTVIVRVDQASEGYSMTMGHPLEIVPLKNPCGVRVGDQMTFRVLFQGKPIGGPDVLVRLATLGPNPKQDPQLTEQEWAIEGYPDARGEVSFPVIAAGQHVVSLRYFDETPGDYAGPLDFASEFSHLRPGDHYERTLYMSTFTFRVEP